MSAIDPRRQQVSFSVIQRWRCMSWHWGQSGGRLSIKMSSYRYMDPRVKDKTVSLTWESTYLVKTVVILRQDPGFHPRVRLEPYVTFCFLLLRHSPSRSMGTPGSSGHSPLPSRSVLHSGRTDSSVPVFFLSAGPWIHSWPSPLPGGSVLHCGRAGSFLLPTGSQMHSNWTYIIPRPRVFLR